MLSLPIMLRLSTNEETHQRERDESSRVSGDWLPTRASLTADCRPAPTSKALVGRKER